VGCYALSSYQVRQAAALLRSGEKVTMHRSALQHPLSVTLRCVLRLVALILDEFVISFVADLLFRNLDVPGSILGPNVGSPDLFIYLYIYNYILSSGLTGKRHWSMATCFSSLLINYSLVIVIFDSVLGVLPTALLNRV
jgi:hypothetical protein